MEYIKVNWIHSNLAYPIVLYSELDSARMEVRKVEIFSSGESNYADQYESKGDTFLSIVPLPALDKIASDPQFEPTLIEKEEFDIVWDKATLKSTN